MSVDVDSLIRAIPFAACLWFAAHAVAAAFTTTEPDIEPEDVRYRLSQTVTFGLLACLCFAITAAVLAP